MVPAGLQRAGQAGSPRYANIRKHAKASLHASKTRSRSKGMPGQLVPRQEAGGQARMALVMSSPVALTAVAPSSH